MASVEDADFSFTDRTGQEVDAKRVSGGWAFHVGGEAIGGIALSVKDACATVEEVKVDPRFRSRGVATEALMRIEDILRRKGIREVVAWINADDADHLDAVRSIYESLGYGVEIFDRLEDGRIGRARKLLG